MGFLVINDPTYVNISNNKYLLGMLLKKYDIPQPKFILVSPECKKHEEYYTASMAVHNKIGDPVLKKYLKKVRRDGKKLGKLYKKKDEISGKFKDFIYGEETDTVIEDISVNSYFENCMDTFLGDIEITEE